MEGNPFEGKVLLGFALAPDLTSRRELQGGADGVAIIQVPMVLDAQGPTPQNFTLNYDKITFNYKTSFW